MKKVLIIIPAYNEEKNIETVVEKIRALKIKNFIIDYIVINDGSEDNTVEVLKNNNYNHINLINNLGIGGAVQTGYKIADRQNYDIAIQIDGDGQHDVGSIKDVLASLIKHDFVIGSRFVQKEKNFKSSFTRRLGIKILSFVIYIKTRKKFYDVTSGYRGAKREVIKLFAKKYPQEFPEPETLAYLIKHKFSVVEIPVLMHSRKDGKSSILGFNQLKYMLKVMFSIIVSNDSKKW